MKILTRNILLLFLIGLISMPMFSGCGGSQMSQLKKRAAARKRASGGNTNNDEDDAPAPKKKAAKSDAEGNAKENVSKDADKSGNSKPAGGNLTKQEQQNLKSVNSGDDGFELFKQEMLAKYAEKEKTLTQVAKYEAVARAFGEYVRLQRGFPPKAIPYRKPTLSWRVALLPYLGYKELHEKFDTASRYNSPLNRRLIELMPPEFKTMDRKTKTTLVAPIISFSAYWRETPSLLNRIEDGISDTIGFVEVDDEHAVTWTQPADYEINAKKMTEGLGSKRGFFVVGFGDGRVEKVAQSVSPKHFSAMLSYDRNDSYPQSAVSELEEADFNPIETANDPAQKLASNKTGAANPNGADKSSAGAGRTVNPRSTTPRASTNSISGRLDEASLNAFAAKDQTAAFHFKLASLLLSNQDGRAFSNYGWSKALQRPSMAVRWSAGILISENQKTVDPVKRTVQRAKGKVQRPGDKELEKFTGQIGQDAMIVLRKLVNDGVLGKYLTENVSAIEVDPKSNAQNQKNNKQSSDEALYDSRKKPLLHYSGVEVHIGPSKSYHMQVARERGNDILLLFEIDLRRAGSETMNITTMYAIDIQKGKEIWKSAPLNNLKIREDRKNALKKDQVFEELKDFDNFCRDNIALTALPVALNRDNVLKRLKVLTGKKDENKLPFLAEAMFYLEENLILLDDYKKFCTEVLGTETEGLQFAVGDPDQQYEVIKKFLPNSFSLVSN